MEINNTEVRLPKINIILLLFISFVMMKYVYGGMVHYLVFLLMFGIILLKLAKGIKINENIKLNQILLLCCVLLFIIYTAHSLSLSEIKVFIKNYLAIFLVMIFGLIQFHKYGIKYGEQFFYQFTIMMNVLSFINIFEFIIHRPLLEMFLTPEANAYQAWSYGSSSFRTISIFGHPIISGLCFSLAFICNIYMIKSRYKFALQLLVLVNIYSTLSRSAWIALSLVFLLYCIKNVRFKKISLSSRFTYKQAFTGFYIICLVVICLMFIFLKFDLIVDAIISRFGDSLSSNSTDVSNLQRTGTMNLIIHHMFSSDVLHFLFGSGLGSAGYFMASHLVVIKGFTTTDNMYLTLFYEVGALALLAYLLFLVISVYRFLFSKKHSLYELASLCFIFITIEMVFFEGLGWGVVGTFWSFTLLILFVTFQKEQVKKSKKSKISTVSLPSVGK